MTILPTILLTGATGFIGSHILEALLNKGYPVVILKRSTSNVWRITHLLDKISTYDIDIDSLETAFTQHHIDIIIHTATFYRKFNKNNDITEMIKSNISFPVELLEIGIRNNLKAFVNTGTFFEYDCSQLPIHEKSMIKPFNFYAKTKLAFENILATYSDQIIINTLRLFSPYGEKDNLKLIPTLIKKSLSNEKIELSDGLQKMDFIYIKDVVSAYLKVIDKIQDQEKNNYYKLYNLGSGIAVSIRDLVSIIEQKLGKTIDKNFGLPSKSDIPIAFADISMISRELNWKPNYLLHDGIENTIKYHQEREGQ